MNGTIEYAVETAPAFVPPGPVAQHIAMDNIPGALYLLDRIRGPGITGHVYNGNGDPLPATIRIIEIQDTFCTPRMCDSLYGRYTRLLIPGEYTIEVSHPDYPTIIESIEVPNDTLAYYDFLMVGVEESINYLHPININCYPNPCRSITNIGFTLNKFDKVRLILQAIDGRKIITILEEELYIGEHNITFNTTALKPGIYFIKLLTTDTQSVCKIVVL